jgi:hypothetical protein
MKLSSAETELKLSLPSGVSSSLFSLPVLMRNRTSEPKSRRLVTTYFETSEGDLGKQGVSLRIRQENDRRIQTVKAAGNSGVASSRGEWEWSVKNTKPDLQLVEATPVSALFAGVSQERLEPAVVIDVVLGEINDAAMATRLAETLAADKHLELGPSVSAIVMSEGRAAGHAMKALLKSWQAYCDEPRFWRRA